MTLVRVKDKYQVTIPASVRSQLGIAQGELLDVRAERGKIVLTPKTVVDRAGLDAGLRGALADARKGNTIGPFKSAAEFRKFRRTRRFKDFVAGK